MKESETGPIANLIVALRNHARFVHVKTREPETKEVYVLEIGVFAGIYD